MPFEIVPGITAATAAECVCAVTAKGNAPRRVPIRMITLMTLSWRLESLLCFTVCTTGPTENSLVLRGARMSLLSQAVLTPFSLTSACPGG